MNSPKRPLFFTRFLPHNVHSSARGSSGWCAIRVPWTRRREVLNEIAFGVARTAQEETVPADALEQFALAALFALFPRGDAGLVGKHLVAGLVEVNDEFFPELFDGFAPGQLAFLDFVEFLFEPRGKRDVENVFETLDQQHADTLTKHRGRESPLVLGDVFAFDDG